jgi:hypothetical protein
MNRFVDKFETTGTVSNKKGVISERRQNTRKHYSSFILYKIGYTFIG